MAISMVGVMLAVGLGAFASIGLLESAIQSQNEKLGREAAGRVKPVAMAVNEYIAENYSHLQYGETININGHAMSAGEMLSPTVDDLIAMHYLPTDFDARVTYIADSEIRIQLRREPEGCVNDGCEIPGIVYLTSAIPKTKTGAVNAVALGAYRQFLGPDAFISVNTQPDKLFSGHGTSVNNPLGSVTGVMAMGAGFGSGAFSNLLSLNDHRDPNFRGDVSVKGELTSETLVQAPYIIGSESVGAGTGTDASGNECRLAEMTKHGEFFSRLGNCVVRYFYSPDTGKIHLNANDGSERIVIDTDAASVSMTDQASGAYLVMDGNNTAIVAGNGTSKLTIDGRNGLLDMIDGLGGQATLSTTGDTLFKSANGQEAGFDASDGSGRTRSNVLHATDHKAPNSVCESPNKNGDIAQNSLSAGLLICSQGLWLKLSIDSGVKAGDLCLNDGALGNSVIDNSALICSGGKWVSLTKRFGNRVFAASYIVSDNSVVPKPSCESGTVGSAIYITPKSINAQHAALNYYARDGGSNWSVLIKNGSGVSVQSEGIAMTYCLYGV